MFKATKWMSEKKKKINAVFKFYITETQEPHLGWENLRVFFFPMVAGKLAAKPEKVAVLYGSPIYLTATLTQNPNTGKINKKVYKFVLSATDSAKFGNVGETEINLADYVETSKPFSFSLLLKAPNAETLMHVTIQRVQCEDERGFDKDGGSAAKKQRRTLWSQFTNTEIEKGKAVDDGANDRKTAKEISYVKNQSEMKLPLSGTLTPHLQTNGNLGKSSISDDISAPGSDCNSIRYTLMENGTKNYINHHGFSTLSPGLSNGDWSVISAPYGSVDGSRTISGKVLLREESQESDNLVEKYKNDVIASTTKLEVSELELRTLQKQIVKESMQEKDASIDPQIMEKERNAIGKECDKLKASKKIAVDEEHVSSKLQFGGKDPYSMLEEAMKELNHVKKLNVDLQLQLKKIHESNSELILTAKNLDELLQQKNCEICSCGCSRTAIKADIMVDLQEKEFVSRSQQLDNSECQQDDEHEQPTQDQNIELKTYQMEYEELEMQMEQLILDHEILKRENDDISTKLREQLRMQFEYSSNLVSDRDLQAQVEILENKLERQAEAFQADLEIISRAKVEQEKRAILAEEALRKTRLYNCNAADQLQEELKRLTLQMSSAFYISEKLVLHSLKEFNKLQLQKCNFEEILRKTNEELELVRQQNNLKCQQLEFKTQEMHSLKLEMQEKLNEFEDKWKFEEAKQRASYEHIAQLEAEIEKHSRKNYQLEEQIKHNQQLKAEMDQLKASMKEREKLLQDYSKERALLWYELALLKEEAKKTLQELIDLRQGKIRNDAEIKNLNAEVAIQRAHCADLKQSMHEGELEKENLRNQIVHLRAELQKEAGIIQKKMKDHKENLTNSDEYMKSPIRTKIYKSTHAGFQFEYDAFEEGRSCGNYLQNPINKERTWMKDVNSIDTESIISDIFDIFTSEKKKKAEVQREMTELEERYTIIETELKEMQERYSHMSLKFAEVEGERQQLVLKIRSLKKTRKIEF